MPSGKPLIVQSDRTIFLEVDHPVFKEARNHLMAFAELEKSPEYVHIYRITSLSLWNAAAAGLRVEKILDVLATYGKYPIPSSLRKEIKEFMDRYGQLRLEQNEGRLELCTARPEFLEEVLHMKHLRECLTDGKAIVRNGLSTIGVKAEFR